MIKTILVLLFWFGIAAYIALSLDGVIMGQSLVLAYLHNVPFKALPVTNGFLLGVVTMAAVFFSLAWLAKPVRSSAGVGDTSDAASGDADPGSVL